MDSCIIIVLICGKLRKGFLGFVWPDEAKDKSVFHWNTDSRKHWDWETWLQSKWWQFVILVLLDVYYQQTLQLAQPIRLLLKYTGTEFEDVQYEQGDGKYTT